MTSPPLHDPDYRAFVMHLTGLRTQLGVTQTELAMRLGKPQSFVSKVERFERRIDPAEFRAFALALGVDAAESFLDVSVKLSSLCG